MSGQFTGSMAVLLVYINSALHRNDINGGHGTAVSLPRAIVGTRQCRVLYIIPVQPELVLLVYWFTGCAS